jgi:hypothetical protein
MSGFLSYKQKWEDRLAGGSVPHYLRSVVRMPFPVFHGSARAAQPEFVDRFVESIHAGDLWILERAFAADEIATIKRAAQAFRASQPVSSPKLVEGCANYHEIVDGSTAPSGGYLAVDHSCYFFRWNGDEHGLFALLDEIWRLAKMVSGRAEDEFEANTPKDSFVDRVQVIQYPTQIGRITAHVDPFITMRVNLGVYLSTYGIDFKQGGFFVARGPGDPVHLDPQAAAGDALLWFPQLIHGVADIDPEEGGSVDWTSQAGRWFVALNTVESAHVAKRHFTKPAHAYRLP